MRCILNSIPIGLVHSVWLSGPVCFCQCVKRLIAHGGARLGLQVIWYPHTSTNSQSSQLSRMQMTELFCKCVFECQLQWSCTLSFCNVGHQSLPLSVPPPHWCLQAYVVLLAPLPIGSYPSLIFSWDVAVMRFILAKRIDLRTTHVLVWITVWSNADTNAAVGEMMLQSGSWLLRSIQGRKNSLLKNNSRAVSSYLRSVCP